MISINSILSEDCILIHPDVTDKKALIGLFVDCLESSGLAMDKKQLIKDVMEREKLSSTGLNNGCAIPHAHSSALSQTALAAAVLKEGVDFATPDSQPAKIVFFIAGPKGNAGHHLKLISKLARVLNDSQFLKQLEGADTKEDFLELIKKREG
jgi:fructose-specific phosphotransferase system IIA component